MKRSSTSRQAAAVVGKLAKAHGKTPAEIELAAAQALARANAADGERLRAERDALAPDAAEYHQQREAEVLVAQLTGQAVPMPLRPAQALRMLRRAQAANAELASRADVASRLDEIKLAVAAAGKTGRTCHGGKHRKNRVSEWGKTQADAAADFNRARRKLEPGFYVGGCTVAELKRWDKLHPDEQHLPTKRPWFLYHAELRLLADGKQGYIEAVRGWAAHWDDYAEQFKAWRKTHPKTPRAAFRWKDAAKWRKVNGMNPASIGVDADGRQYAEPNHERETRGRRR